ncbi:MAG: hypothetical protein AAGF48_15945 [Pseudomonadota bacterium]
MEAVFSKEIQEGLSAARVASLKRASRLRVLLGDEMHPVLRLWKGGFSVASDSPVLRGFVDLYDGSIHLFQCLIVTSEDSGGERSYEFKRATAVVQSPARDFEVDETAPVALIEQTLSRSTADR